VAAGGWIAPDGSIGSVEIESGHRHCYVPDSRIGLDFEYSFTEVYSTRLKGFPCSGVSWV
jgi:hypothetical protein